MRIFLILILFFAGARGVISQENKILEQILTGMKYHQSLLKTWKLNCILKGETLKSSVIHKKGIHTYTEVWAQKGEKIYYEIKDNNGKTKSICTFDGKILQVWGANKKAIISVPQEKKIQSTFFNSRFTPFHLLYLLSGTEKPIFELLEEKDKIKNLRIYEKEMKGEECYVVEFAYVERFPFNSKIWEEVYEYTLWLDKNKNFLPLKKIMIWKQQGEISLKIITTDITLQRFNDKIWFPVKAMQEGYVYNKGGEVRSHVITKMELQNIEINKGIPDSFFQIKFPPGTKVWDERTGVSYIVK